LALVSTEEQARRFVELGWELIPRQPTTHRLTDEDQIDALIGIAHAHPGLRVEAVDQLLQALLIDQEMARLVLRNGSDLLRDDPPKTVAAVGEAAAEGSQYAALALVAAQYDMTQAVSLARRQVEAAVAPRVHEAGVHTIGTGLTQAAGLVTVLPEEDRIRFARGVLDFANDEQEPSQNRYEALVALRAVVRSLPNDVRHEVFEQVLQFVQDQRQTAEEEGLLLRMDDPLQRFRISSGTYHSRRLV
jgi:hypothetical protein